MIKYVISYIFVFSLILLVSGICWAKKLEPAEVAPILNLLRQSISSGELRVTYSEIKIRTMESIEEQIENIKKRAEASSKDLKEFENLFSRLRKREKTMLLEERNICFEVNTNSPALEINRYRIVSLDRNLLNPLSDEGRFIHAGYCKVITYDGQLGAVEIDSPFLNSSITLTENMSPKLPFHLFGRSLNILPDSQINLTWKNIDGETLCELQFPIEIRKGLNGICKLLINPNKGFVVLKEEHFTEGNTVFSADYKNFDVKDSIFYPGEIEMKWYGSTGLEEQVNIEVKDKVFNIEFPPDFFVVTRTLHPGQTINPVSPIKPAQQSKQSQQTSIQKTTLLSMCGPLSLQFICEKFGIKTDIDELLKFTDYKEDIGTSMKGLYNAAREKGLNPEGILIKSKSLDVVSLPAIAHIDQNHFIVITSISKGEIGIFDPASDRKAFQIKEFKERWDGYLLTFAPISESVLSSTEVPKIQVQEAEHDFRRIRGGQYVEHIFTIANVGKAPLKISEADSSCSCTTAFLSEPTIPPGENLQIKVQVAIPKKNGNIEQFVRLHTNDPNHPTFELKLKAVVYLPIEIIPSHLYLGKILSGALVTKTIEMEYSSEKTKVLGLRTSSDFVHARLLNEHHRLEVHVNPQVIGWFSEKIFIDYLNQGEKLILEIPVQGEFTGDFEISPQNIFFGMVNLSDKGNNLSREVIITATKQDLRIVSAESQFGHISTEIIFLEKEKKYKIKISLHSVGQTSGLLKDVVKIRTNSQLQEKLEIPVYAYITKAE